MDDVWEWCKNVWYSNATQEKYDSTLFENDVKMYGTQTGQIYINGINILLINFWWMNVVLVEMKKHIKGHY